MKTENRKQYSKTELYLGNLAVAIWISLGAVACSVFVPLAGVGFFAVAAFLVFYELGKHGCVTCYYCKTCTIGMGKLPELFFRKTGTANVNRRALKLFPWIYVLMSIIPIVLAAVGLAEGFAAYKVLLLSAILAFSVYTGIVRRKEILAPV